MLALLLVVGAACWPRARGAQSAAELAQTTRSATRTRTAGTRPVTTAAKLVSAPGTAKLVVAEADESDLTN
jgi:hypothetical protein